ncbi:MAG: CBS domain-containing protein [Flavobacteriaceae bacterium]|jgi:CBS domain-containing protein|nr:CBS domain-containing protein [Flavobacteriaceae bacterium]
MFIKEYITKDYPAFNVSDSVEDAREIVKEFGYSHIFINKNGIFQGTLSRVFLDENSEKKSSHFLDELQIHYEKFAITEDANLLDSIRLFHVFNANVIPVINIEEQYLGYLSSDDIFNEFSKYPLFSENGAFLVIQTNNKCYSFTEITNIVESNNAKIYGCYISGISDDAIQISLKISGENLRSIGETFERYGYSVLHKYYDDEKEELVKDRFEFFQKYMEF